MSAETERFGFGANWSRFADQVDPTDLDRARLELAELLQGVDLEGASFLDIGSGSGLHSAAALQLGVRRLAAVDYDPQSVATTEQVLARFAPPGAEVRVEQGDILTGLDYLGLDWDVVYSWGVLHHTGHMWDAIGNAARLVRPGGTLAIALYLATRLDRAWVAEKRLYNRVGRRRRRAMDLAFGSFLLAGHAALGRDPRKILRQSNGRGMRFWTDVSDWLGGLPYEAAAPEEVVRFLSERGFELSYSAKTRQRFGAVFGAGCAEYVFRRGLS